MLLKSTKLTLITALLISSYAQAYSFEDLKLLWNNRTTNQKRAAQVALGLTTLAGACILGKMLYTKTQKKINEKVENEIVDSIVFVFTSNYSISKLPKQEREHAFRKKAKLINTRIRVMKRLDTLVNDANSSLSEQHQMQLKDRYNQAKSVFKYVDMARESFLSLANPYEQEYKNNTLVDAIVENKIVDSIILSCKPVNEYTAADNINKQEADLRRANILKKLENKLSIIWFNKLQQNPFILDFLK